MPTLPPWTPVMSTGRDDHGGSDGVPRRTDGGPTTRSVGASQRDTARPLPLNATVSAQMSRMPRERTKPEMLLRRELHRRGLRFRVNYRAVPGRPDVAFTRARLAVFVDGCFWHLCPAHAVLPKNNATWWREKLHRNVQRDREKDEALAALGWTVLHVWEHEDPMAVAGIVEQLWRARCRSDATAWPVT